MYCRRRSLPSVPETSKMGHIEESSKFGTKNKKRKIDITVCPQCLLKIPGNQENSPIWKYISKIIVGKRSRKPPIQNKIKTYCVGFKFLL